MAFSMLYTITVYYYILNRSYFALNTWINRTIFEWEIRIYTEFRIVACEMVISYAPTLSRIVVKVQRQQHQIIYAYEEEMEP